MDVVFVEVEVDEVVDVVFVEDVVVEAVVV